ncbi:MAG TPA: MaoC family dehydratase [Caldimonas sp.]|nr:MaoC family dehydratase [Caldimonas sp.]
MEGPATVATWESLVERVGQEIGCSAWRDVDQATIAAFGATTGDRYFLHMDPERAKATPFGATIAHGMLTLSLVPAMGYEVCPYVEGARYPLNYGFNRVRFVAPVIVGSRLRARFALQRAEVVSADQRQLTYDVTVERDGHDRPALVAEWLMRYVF